jgi:hypothetical protein
MRNNLLLFAFAANVIGKPVPVSRYHPPIKVSAH